MNRIKLEEHIDALIAMTYGLSIEGISAEQHVEYMKKMLPKLAKEMTASLEEGIVSEPEEGLLYGGPWDEGDYEDDYTWECGQGTLHRGEEECDCEPPTEEDCWDGGESQSE